MPHELFNLSCIKMSTSAWVLFTVLLVIAIFSVLGGNKKKQGSEKVTFFGYTIGALAEQLICLHRKVIND